MKLWLRILVQISLLVIVLACMPEIIKTEQQERMHIIPIPLKMDYGTGHFVLNAETKIVYQNSGKEFEFIVNQLVEKVSQTFSFSLKKWENSPSLPNANYILLKLDKSAIKLGDEGYHLSVTPNRILIESYAVAGTFYGYQTLRQLLPLLVEASHSKQNGWRIPSLDIIDKPRFAWRGNMLDPSRHFLPVEFIKKNLDYLASLKMNRFHWHLTDDQGWRIQVNTYPNLTKTGAWRVDRNDEPWWGRAPQQPGEKATYGGYYTKEQIREIVKYAKERFITIVPEIDMPGHSQAIIASYPEVSCDGGTYYVATGGVADSNTVCPGKEVSFEFIENVLSDVLALFPGEYFHIGGDECNKSMWQTCADCQRRIADEKLKDEHELQSYFIRRVEKIVNKLGKKLIGWDEILEGGLAPNATVMSWRGEEGGIEAVKAGHDVIMTPNQYCYLDLKQGDPELEPELGYSQLLLSTVYSYNPIPKDFSSEEARHILGVQGNLWGESIQEEKHANYMLFPRMFAIAEVAWSAQSNRLFNDFINRMEHALQRLEAQGINYAASVYNVSVTPGYNENTKQIEVTMKTEIDNLEIRYTVGGHKPSLSSLLYTKPLAISKTKTIKAGTFREGRLLGKITEKTIQIHKAAGKIVKIVYPSDNKYDIGEYGLTDCIRGTKEEINEKWMGIEGDDFEAVVDMERENSINKISVSFLVHTSKWVFPPERVEFFVSSDHENYTIVGSVNGKEIVKPELSTKEFSVSPKTKARYIKIKAKNISVCPDWHKGAGDKAWIFTDEVIVE